MIEVLQTPQDQSWFDGLRDREAKLRTVTRIRRLSLGTVGDARSGGGGVSELHNAHCPG